MLEARRQTLVLNMRGHQRRVRWQSTAGLPEDGPVRGYGLREVPRRQPPLLPQGGREDEAYLSLGVALAMR